MQDYANVRRLGSPVSIKSTRRLLYTMSKEPESNQDFSHVSESLVREPD